VTVSFSGQVISFKKNSPPNSLQKNFPERSLPRKFSRPQIPIFIELKKKKTANNNLSFMPKGPQGGSKDSQEKPHKKHVPKYKGEFSRKDTEGRRIWRLQAARLNRIIAKQAEEKNGDTESEKTKKQLAQRKRKQKSRLLAAENYPGREKSRNNHYSHARREKKKKSGLAIEMVVGPGSTCEKKSPVVKMPATIDLNYFTEGRRQFLCENPSLLHSVPVIQFDPTESTKTPSQAKNNEQLVLTRQRYCIFL
jgi:hypothetical protein